nr:hypothetical protein Iba_chr03aCG7240 [Ipomoea batatas]
MLCSWNLGFIIVTRFHRRRRAAGRHRFTAGALLRRLCIAAVESLMMHKTHSFISSAAAMNGFGDQKELSPED